MKLLVQLPLLLLPLAAVQHRAAAAGEGCQLADSEKVDCGQVGTDQAGCEAMGCCWQPVDADAASTENNSSRAGKCAVYSGQCAVYSGRGRINSLY